MLPELVQLNQIRLDEDLSFGELAEAIGLGDHSTLHKLLKGDGQRGPSDRTLHKIRRYLRERQEPRTTGRRRVAAGVAR